MSDTARSDPLPSSGTAQAPNPFRDGPTLAQTQSPPVMVRFGSLEGLIPTEQLQHLRVFGVQHSMQASKLRLVNEYLGELDSQVHDIREHTISVESRISRALHDNNKFLVEGEQYIRGLSDVFDNPEVSQIVGSPHQYPVPLQALYPASDDDLYNPETLPYGDMGTGNALPRGARYLRIEHMQTSLEASYTTRSPRPQVLRHHHPYYPYVMGKRQMDTMQGTTLPSGAWIIPNVHGRDHTSVSVVPNSCPSIMMIILEKRTHAMFPLLLTVGNQIEMFNSRPPRMGEHIPLF